MALLPPFMTDTDVESSEVDAMVMEPYRTTFDNAAESVSESVISAVADATGSDPVAMPPLYNAINPDALDALFQPATAAPKRGDRTLTFTYNDHRVTVSSDGVLVVEPFGGESH